MGKRLTESFRLQQKANRRKEKADREALEVPTFKNLDISYDFADNCKNIMVEVVDLLSKTEKDVPMITNIQTNCAQGQTYLITSIICPICKKEILLNKHWNCFICNAREHEKAIFNIINLVS